MSSLLTFTDKGIYCEPGDFFIDPWKKVTRAIITHGHSDHARSGHQHYLAHQDSEPILRLRLGKNIHLQTVEYGEFISFNGVHVSLHPAGHIYGSAQVRVEFKGEIWVVTGDYKLENDGVCQPFEPIKCHKLITEATFGLPIYQWQPQQEIFDDMIQWWKNNAADGYHTVLYGYSLGKSQRILAHLPQDSGPIIIHPTIEAVNTVFRDIGFDLPKPTTTHFSPNLTGALIMTTPTGAVSDWLKPFGPYRSSFISGWNLVRKSAKGIRQDRGFVLSDHADWNGLNEAVRLSEAEKIYVTHGEKNVFSRWLKENGYDAEDVETLFSSEGETM